MPTAPTASADRLNRAIVLLLLAVTLVILPVAVMTADHFVRQKPGLERQTAVFAAFGFTSPCFFPSGHPARTMIDNHSPFDWRPSPSLPRAVPGPPDLLRPRDAALKRTGHGR